MLGKKLLATELGAIVSTAWVIIPLLLKRHRKSLARRHWLELLSLEVLVGNLLVRVLISPMLMRASRSILSACRTLGPKAWLRLVITLILLTTVRSRAPNTLLPTIRTSIPFHCHFGFVKNPRTIRFSNSTRL